jgi:hypothetical protein
MAQETWQAGDRVYFVDCPEVVGTVARVYVGTVFPVLRVVVDLDVAMPGLGFVVAKSSELDWYTLPISKLESDRQVSETEARTEV